VRGPDRKEILIPAIAGVIIDVDLEAGRLVVKLLEGLR
jgi:ribosomal 30S subunit maturation factor RimM